MPESADMLTLLVETACCELPYGLQLNIACEKGSAWVELYDREERVWLDLPDPTDKTLHQQVQDGIDAAKEYK